MSAMSAPPKVKIEESSDSDLDSDIEQPTQRNRKRIYSDTDSDSDNFEEFESKKPKFTPKALNTMSHATRQCFYLLSSKQRSSITDRFCTVSLRPSNRQIANQAVFTSSNTTYPHYRTLKVQHSEHDER